MTDATMPDLSLDANAKADDWTGSGLTYRVETQFGRHVTQAQLHADLRAAPGWLAAHHPAVVISDDGHASIQLDVTAVDIGLALLGAMFSVKGVFHEPLAGRGPAVRARHLGVPGAPVGGEGFAYRRVKNDFVDAADLADLLRMGRLTPPIVLSHRTPCRLARRRND